MNQAAYPIQFSVDYPDRPLDRVKTLFRPIVAIPILLVLGAVSGATTLWTSADGGTVAAGAGGVLFLGPLLMIVFRRKYPRWWFEFNRELLRFSNRVGAYLALMDDRYPSTDEEQHVHLEVAYPDAQQDLNRWMPLVKWFLAIPHYLALIVLWLGAIGAVIVAWFAILFTGRYPRALFDYVEGVLRWQNRVIAYVGLPVTDDYPPFRLAE